MYTMGNLPFCGALPNLANPLLPVRICSHHHHHRHHHLAPHALALVHSCDDENKRHRLLFATSVRDSTEFYTSCTGLEPRETVETVVIHRLPCHRRRIYSVSGRPVDARWHCHIGYVSQIRWVLCILEALLDLLSSTTFPSRHPASSFMPQSRTICCRTVRYGCDQGSDCGVFVHCCISFVRCQAARIRSSSCIKLPALRGREDKMQNATQCSGHTAETDKYI